MRRALWLVPPAIALTAAFVRPNAAWIETHYSRGAYLVLERRLTPWANVVPLAVTDVLLAAAALAVFAIVHGWLRRSRGGTRALALARAVAAATATASAIYVLFVGMWGLNYGREPLTARLDFDRARATPAAATRFAGDLVDRVNALHDEAHDAGWPAWEALPGTLGESFERVQRQVADVQPAVAGVPKWSILTFYFERAGVSGMTNPFALEVVVDRSQLPFERPYVAAHEWAHLAGYAREDEASFIGWLVCRQGPPGARYSAELAVLVSLVGSLPASERRTIVGTIAPGPRRDIQAMAARSARVWPWLRRPAWWVYDRYLRANRVEQGVGSYGAALELMLGTRLDERGRPVRRKDSEVRR